MKLNKESKEWVQFLVSLLVLLAGIVLVFISLFLQPVGVIHYTVLTAFGMFLTFVGAVWNLDVKYTYKVNELHQEFELQERKREMYERYGRKMREMEEMQKEFDGYENTEVL